MPARLDRHLSLSGPAASVRPVRAAQDLAGGSTVLRAALCRAPVAGYRHRRGGPDAHRHRGLSSLCASGSDAYAHDHRLIATTLTMERPPPSRLLGELNFVEMSRLLME